MTMLAPRSGLYRWRRSVLLVAVIAGLGASVAIHHLELPDVHDMADASMCLAVAVGGMALLATALRPAPLSWPKVDTLAIADSPHLPSPPAAARDGPAVLQVFLR